jgi:alkanesulfonate monooxygenase SsuD/methylene tetrahydromethanopterin reductase-like flavin-dependent oxidoreductase (luciferase family)
MRVGVVFPQTELGGDPGAVRAYAQEVERLGFTHILVYEHVVGADRNVRKDFEGPYDVESTFHEPFVMFGYLAAISSLELVTGVIVLPQRQTALVAKQAAEVDVLSSGRLRLGIGVGWNAVEYVALGENFGNRGKRSAEQIALLRRLWTEPVVTFDGEFHKVTGSAWRRCRYSGRSRCGSAPRRLPVTGGSGDSPTVGSPWCRRGRNSTRRAERLSRPLLRPAAIPARSGWKPAWRGAATRDW